MTVDKSTGCITFPEIGASVSASLSRPQFLSASAFGGAVVMVRNEPWCSYRLPDIAQTDTSLCVILQFHGDSLLSLSLSHEAERFGKSWADWSEKQELARKAFHEHWLTHDLCARVGHYPWGEISSDYDAKGGSSSITIRFSNRSA